MAQAQNNTIKTLGGSARGADSPPRKGREFMYFIMVEKSCFNYLESDCMRYYSFLCLGLQASKGAALRPF